MSTTSTTLISGNTVAELIASGTRALTAAGVAFGHGTATAEDEAAWLTLWKLGLPLDSELAPGAPESLADQAVSAQQQAIGRNPQRSTKQAKFARTRQMTTGFVLLDGVPGYACPLMQFVLRPAQDLPRTHKLNGD